MDVKAVFNPIFSSLAFDPVHPDLAENMVDELLNCSDFRELMEAYATGRISAPLFLDHVNASLENEQKRQNSFGVDAMEARKEEMERI